MRIQIQSRRFAPDLYGGLEVHLTELTRVLASRGHDLSVLTEHYPHPTMVDDEPLPGVPCRRIPTAGRGPLWRVAPWARVACWARHQRGFARGAQVVLPAYAECVVSSRLTRPRTPILYKIISISAFRGSLGDAVADPRLYRIERLAARFADHIVVESALVRRQAIEWLGVPAEKVDVLPNGKDLTRFERPADLPAARPGDALRLLFVGRLDEEKDVAFALRALSLMRHRAATRVALVGAGPHEPELRQLVDRLGVAAQVEFVGKVAEPERWMWQADVFILPSRRESFGNVLVEAMAAGLACVTRRLDYPAIPVAGCEIVEDGVTGYCVDAHDPADMAARLDDLWADRARCAAMGAAGLARARERYTLARMAERYEAVLARLAGVSLGTLGAVASREPTAGLQRPV